MSLPFETIYKCSFLPVVEETDQIYAGAEIDSSLEKFEVSEMPDFLYCVKVLEKNE